MDTKMVVKALKDRIRYYSERQRPLKRARKTTLPDAERIAALEQAGESKETTPAGAAWEVKDRRAIITACLNFVHEICGSEYQHGPGDVWLYDKHAQRLRKEFLVAK